LQTQGKLGEAEPLYRRALAINEASLGPTHPDVANSLNNFAVRSSPALAMTTAMMQLLALNEKRHRSSFAMSARCR
jgi:methylthioribose-1-phosphate isomerase